LDSVVLETESFVIQAEQLEDGGVEMIEWMNVFDGFFVYRNAASPRLGRDGLKAVEGFVRTCELPVMRKTSMKVLRSVVRLTMLIVAMRKTGCEGKQGMIQGWLTSTR
jgi:hypothetical protein